MQNYHRITAILMDVQPITRKMRIQETNTELGSRVFNKPILDHHIDALSTNGVNKHIVLSDRVTSKTFQSSGATFKESVSFSKFLTLQDLNNDFFIFLPANVYLHFDVEYFIKAHFESGQSSSRVSPLSAIKNRSLSYFDPIILNRIELEDLFTQVSRLSIDTLRVYLNQKTEVQRIPTHVITSTLSSPAQTWKLHQQLHRLHISSVNPAGYPHRKNLWAGLNASIPEDCQVNDLVMAGNNVVIKKGVTFKGLVIIGDDVVIDSGATIKNSIVENDTYVGKNVVLENALVRGNRLHRVDRGLRLDIEENQILGKSNWLSRMVKKRSSQGKNDDPGLRLMNA